MSIHLVCFASANMTISQDRLVESARKFGFTRTYVYRESDLRGEIMDFNKDILAQPRGCGFWLWKSWLILRAMQYIPENDILIYCDSGVEITGNVRQIIDAMDQDIFFFSNGFPMVEWSKMDVLKGIMPDINWYSGEARQHKQVQASVIFFKVNQNTRDFVKTWLLYCQMPGWLDDSPSKQPNVATFAENRHDQSILSLLALRGGYRLHYYPMQYAEHIKKMYPQDKYPIIFNHHRKRNHEYNQT